MPDSARLEEPFERFLLEAASKGELVNTMFEERLFSLIAVIPLADLLRTSSEVRPRIRSRLLADCEKIPPRNPIAESPEKYRV